MMKQPIIKNALFATISSALTYLSISTASYAAPDMITTSFKGWVVQCVNKQNNAGQVEEHACEMLRDIIDPESNSRILRILVSPIAENESDKYVRLTFITPLGVDLEKYLRWSANVADGFKETREEFYSICTANGCSAEFDLSEEELNLMLTAKALDVSFGLPQEDDLITVSIPVLGMDEAYEARSNGG